MWSPSVSAEVTAGPIEGANPSPRQPSKILALIGPFGLGHFYLGQTRRAVLWLVLAPAASLLGALVVLAFEDSPNLGVAFATWIVGVVVAWLLVIVDVAFVRAARMRRTSWLKVAFFWIVGIVVVGAARVAIRVLLTPYKIPARSMQPTLLVGDHFFTNKFAFHSRGPKRGEVIVFRFPGDPSYDFVKRTIALGGDSLEVKNGHPWINGWEVPSCTIGKAELPSADGVSELGEVRLEFLDGEAYLTFFADDVSQSGLEGPYVVAPNEVWVLGDNRNNSRDSRYWFDGSV